MTQPGPISATPVSTTPARVQYASPGHVERTLWPWALTLVWFSMAAGVGILGLGAYIADGMRRVPESAMIMMAGILYGVACVFAVGVMLVGRRLFIKMHWVLQWMMAVGVFFLNIAIIVGVIVSASR